MLKSTVFRVAVRTLAWLGVFSTLAHLSVIALFYVAALNFSEFGEAELATFNKRLASEPRAPQWFHEGDRIAFSHAGRVYVIDSAGSHLQLIHGKDPVGYDTVGLAFGPRVSPDGSRIAYSAYERSGLFGLTWAEGWEIVTAKPDSSGKRKLTENDKLDINPVWSLDGTRIFFDSITKHRRGFYVMAADGSDSSSAVKVVDAGGSPVPGSPVLSPDGNHMAFTVSQGQVGGRGTYVVGADGLGLRKVADDTGLPAWSPDGRRLAFARLEVRDSRQTAVGIYTIGLDGSALREILDTSELVAHRVYSLEWSPDGAEILLSSNGGYPSGGDLTGGVFLINTDDLQARKILDRVGGHASWSPDGSRIAVYAGDHSNDSILYTVGPDGLDSQILVALGDDGNLAAAQGRPLPQR